MNNKPLLVIAVTSALIAIVVVVILKLMGHSSPTVIAGGVSGGVVGALGTAMFRRKKQ